MSLKRGCVRERETTDLGLLYWFVEAVSNVTIYTLSMSLEMKINNLSIPIIYHILFFCKTCKRLYYFTSRNNSNFINEFLYIKYYSKILVLQFTFSIHISGAKGGYRGSGISVWSGSILYCIVNWGNISN